MTPLSQSGAQRTDRPDEPQRLASWYTPCLSDAIGDRLLMFDNSTSSSLELLRFKPEFSRVPAFEDALRRRVDELAHFTHPSIAKVRAVESLSEEDGLALISNHTVGRRLSEVQRLAHGPQFATELVAQLVPVLAALQDQGDGMAHGMLTPERVIVMPGGRLMLTEHVLGSAVNALRLSPARLRDELGLVTGPVTLGVDDPRADIVQLGYLAVTLLVGQPVRSLEAARKVVSWLSRQSLGKGHDAPVHLRRWLGRALDVEGRPFASANDAELALTEWPESELPYDDSIPSGMVAPTIDPARECAVAAPSPREPIVIEGPLDLGTPAPPPAISEAPVEPIERTTSEPVRPVVEPVRPDVEPARQAREGIKPVVVGEIEAPARIALVVTLPGGLPIARWLVGGLTLVCFVESLIIVGLLASRRQTTSATTIERKATVATAPAEPPASVPAAQRAPARSAVRPPAPTPSPAARVTPEVRPAELAATAPAPAPGWLTVVTPFELQVYEGSTLLGSTARERITLPAGPHTLLLVAEALDFEATVRVDIPAGGGMTTDLPVPNGTLSLNALPWANVSLDGQSLGATPFANLSVPIGTHEVIWHHPALGERRQTVVLTAKTPVRLVADLRR
jgi:hypothetical protein